MKPVNFKEANRVVVVDVVDGQGDFPAHLSGSTITSKWELSWREWFYVLWHGHVWVSCSQSQPPMALWAEYPFEDNHNGK